ncbi:hypothetical protein DV737_g531, partial [Chaetothyriales sp. CBS 132003]
MAAFILTYRKPKSTLNSVINQHRRSFSIPRQESTRLLTWELLPEWYQDAPLIRSGYRSIYHSSSACFKSMLAIHNETVNIWTHLVPAFGFTFGIFLLQFAIHLYYPEASMIDRVVFAVNIFCAIVTLTLSSLYHTLMCHSEWVSNLWLRLDYVGILSLILGSFFSGIYVGFYCESTYRTIYWGMIIIFSATAANFVLNPHFQGLKFRALRTWAFILTGLSGFVPIAHGLILYGWNEMWIREDDGNMVLQHQHALLGAFAAFVGWGLVVQGLPVLRFIGYAFVGGALTATALFLHAITSVSRPRTNSLCSESAPPSHPAFLAPQAWDSEIARIDAAFDYQPVELYDQSFVVSKALDSIIALSLRDFISSWYQNITTSPLFVNEVDKNTRSALIQIRDRLLNEDIVNVVVTKLVPLITNHLRDYDQAERLVKGRAAGLNITDSEELDLAIAAKYRDGKLHPAASLAFSNTKSIEQGHLRKIVARILPEVVSDDIIRSRAVLVLVKEIVACAILFPLMQMLKDPDTWNQIVEAYGRTALQDRKTVRRMRAALDEHTSPAAKTRPEQEFPRLSANDSERAFERFVRAIRKTKNLSDARRFRSQVASQLKKESMVDNQDPIYLRRLEMGKRVLDQKIAKLTSASNAALSGNQPHPEQYRNGVSTPKQRELSLVEIMHTASGLSYFMEYMDRQKRMSLVQFWVVVDGFRNPLEDDFGDDAILPSGNTTWTDTDRIDIAQISETYMSKPELNVPQESKDTIRAFLLAGRKATQTQYQAARTAILSAQSAVLEELQSQHFPNFKKSDLYYKFLATDEARSNSHVSTLFEEPLRASSPVRQHAPPLALPPNRSSSQSLAKSKDLRRAALSSTDIKSMSSGKLFDDDIISGPRDSEHSTPLFDDGYDTDALANSSYSIGHDSLNGATADEKQVIENMEAAMNNIMKDTGDAEAVEEQPDIPVGSPHSIQRSLRDIDSSRSSLEMPRMDANPQTKAKPSLATLGLVNTASRIGVFSDNDLFPDQEKFIEDEYADEDTENKDIGEYEIHEAAPGDLGLTEAITALSTDIERLVAQEGVVEALTRKAELTNNLAELRILGKSKASLQREIRRKELQRQQYIVQESDNSLYGRSSIRIKSVVVGREDDGREFALYVIEVQRKAGDQMPAATWAIARRYSEFHELQQRLRRRYPSTRNLDFPRRHMVMKLQKQLLQTRRAALQTYLQQLLRIPDVCRSRELRAFLSQQAIIHDGESSASDTQDIVTRIYNSVSDGMDEFLGNASVLDQLSAAGQNLITAATGQLGTTQDDVITIEPGSVAEAEAELRAFEDKELEPFVKPICDIFLEIFELNRGNNWLRGRAVVVVLHQLLGGTIERKVRELVKAFMQEDSLLRYIDNMKDAIWPGGGVRRQLVPRTAAAKTRTKKEAGIVLATLLPDLAANVVGRSNSKAAARKITAAMNNTRLNQHLAFTMLDEIIGVLFDIPRQKKITSA